MSIPNSVDIFFINFKKQVLLYSEFSEFTFIHLNKKYL